MPSWLKQSTAVDIGVGPFLDDTDGKTAETALTITQPDIRLKKNGGAWAQKNAAQTLSHEEAGWYEVSLDTTDTNTLGILIVAIHESGALPVWKEYMVVPANAYDSLVAGSATLSSSPVAADVRSAIGLASANLDTQLDALPTAAENQSGMATAANLATVAGYLDTEIAAILADTNELQTDWANGGRLDLILDTAAAGGGLDAAGVRAAIGLASANLDTQLDALPTATENADALLNRNMASVSDTNARSPLNALRFLRNRWSLSGTTLTVTEEDDTTPAWTAVVTASPGADPISGSDPA
jgi:hypothetical protein